MQLETIFFFFFSGIILTSAIFVIYSTNTIYSAFFLILSFINSTGILLLSEVEFISIMLIIIYVGAITVLFLFVLMMLDIKILLTKNSYVYLPIIFLILFNFFLETAIIFSKNITTYTHIVNSSLENLNNFYFYKQFITKIDFITNLETIGQVLYTYYLFYFLTAGIILLIALIGAVILTKKENKKQFYLNKYLYKQLSRNYNNSIFNITK